MIPRQYRLKHMKDFEILFKEGHFVGGEFVTIKMWKIDPSKYERRHYSVEDLKIGFVAGRKVSKSAVKRNRIKRQMREVVRLHLKQNNIQKGYMLLVIAKPGVLEKNYQEIEKNITVLLTRAKLFV